MKSFLPLGILLLLQLPATSANSQNLLTNGSFENPVVSSNDNFTGSFSFPGWTGLSTGSGGNGNAGIVAGNNFGLTPFDGNQAFSFNGINPPAGTYLEQTFSTSSGTLYSVSFAVGRNGQFGNQILTLESQVFDASANQLACVTSAPPSVVGWSTADFTFLADSNQSTLMFTDISGSNPSSDLFIDAVGVSEVPEPATLTLVCIGFTLLLFRNRRQRANRDLSWREVRESAA